MRFLKQRNCQIKESIPISPMKSGFFHFLTRTRIIKGEKMSYLCVKTS